MVNIIFEASRKIALSRKLIMQMLYTATRNLIKMKTEEEIVERWNHNVLIFSPCFSILHSMTKGEKEVEINNEHTRATTQLLLAAPLSRAITKRFSDFNCTLYTIPGEERREVELRKLHCTTASQRRCVK